MCVYIYIYTYLSLYVYVCIYIYIYIYIHIMLSIVADLQPQAHGADDAPAAPPREVGQRLILPYCYTFYIIIVLYHCTIIIVIIIIIIGSTISSSTIIIIIVIIIIIIVIIIIMIISSSSSSLYCRAANKHVSVLEPAADGGDGGVPAPSAQVRQRLIVHTRSLLGCLRLGRLKIR